MRAWVDLADHRTNWREVTKQDGAIQSDLLPEGKIKDAVTAMKLMDFSMCHMYNEIRRNPAFGKLPLLSKQYVGALMSESFCERCFSAANLVVNATATRTLPEMVSIKVISRVNKRLIDICDQRTKSDSRLLGLQPELGSGQESKRVGDDMFM